MLWKLGDYFQVFGMKRYAVHNLRKYLVKIMGTIWKDEPSENRWALVRDPAIVELGEDLVKATRLVCGSWDIAKASEWQKVVADIVYASMEVLPAGVKEKLVHEFPEFATRLLIVMLNGQFKSSIMRSLVKVEKRSSVTFRVLPQVQFNIQLTS